MSTNHGLPGVCTIVACTLLIIWPLQAITLCTNATVKTAVMFNHKQGTIKTESVSQDAAECVGPCQVC